MALCSGAAVVNATDRDFAEVRAALIREGLESCKAETATVAVLAQLDNRGRIARQAKCARCDIRDADDQASLCVLCLNEPTLADDRRELEANFAMDDAKERARGGLF